VGEIHFSNWTHAITAVFNPWIACGIVCLIIFFGSYLASLSWADLTFVLPATAIGYVVLALLSKYFLHEQISLARWAGIGMIVAGVGFVAGGPSVTERNEGHEIAELVGKSEEQV
jgi:drug/metabolite transporter (DMT)-like permease